MNREKLKSFFSDKTVRAIALALLALLLLFAAWKVFFSGNTSSVSHTEEELRLSAVLGQIEGVGDVDVMITTSDGTAVSAVVVCKGADSILTRMRDELTGDGRLSFLSAERLDCLRFALLCLTVNLEQQVAQWQRSRFDDVRRGMVLRWLRRKISLLSVLADFADRLEGYRGGTAKCQ